MSGAWTGTILDLAPRANIPLTDDTYVVYAGVDTLLTARRYPVLAAKVEELENGK